jgi:hypothetical protein
MLLDAKWPWDFQNVVIIEIQKKIDTVMVLLKYDAGNFSPYFDHSFEEHPTYFA